MNNNELITPISEPTATSANVTMEMIVGSVEIGDDGNSNVNYFVKFSAENSNHHILYPWEGLKTLVQSWVLIEKEMEKNVE